MTATPLFLAGTIAGPGFGAALPQTSSNGEPALGTIEKRIGGRLGVALVDAAGKPLMLHRSDERFAMCSTFKASLAAAILEAIGADQLRADTLLTITADDLVTYAPYVEPRLAQRDFTVVELLEASVQLSDNVATNALLKVYGGPQKLTRFYRGKGDSVTRLDRYELELNENALGDPRDTSSPFAMARLMADLCFGTALRCNARDELKRLMAGSKTGADRIRAGVPEHWHVGNKTGTGYPEAKAVNDIAFLETPEKGYILVIYSDRAVVSYDAASAAIAEVAAHAAERIARV
ncbi:MAG: class A beta-lactamase [Pseudomonadota bacterium]